MTNELPHPPVDLAGRLCDATTGALELFAVHLGRQLGLYDVLDRQGPASAAELGARAGIAERYAAEWLEQQAVSGFLAVVPGDGDTARFELPAAHRGALVDPLDGDHVAPFAEMVVGIAGVLDEVLDAYRTGGGVPYAHYGAAFRHGQGCINRPAFTSDLVKAWLPAVAGLGERLDGGVVLDVGCGHGWSTIAVQAAWPSATVIGLDTDEASVADARGHAVAAGVAARFEVAGGDPAVDLASYGPVDVVLILEALHDMARPGDILGAARAALAPGGIVVIADEAVAEAFSAPGDDLERMMYGWSVTHCLPAAMAEPGSAALGTALRPATVARLAAEAGFGSCDVVDVDAGFFRIYRLAA
jgi:2-polyprenyl-3-methyl-5-hydroxy-6-metoxy-1,4-benzoquinol methylase